LKFWDTSAIVPLAILEAATVHVHATFKSDAGMAVWWGTDVELRSAVANRERTGQIAADLAARCNVFFDRLRGSWREIEPTETIRRTAGRLVRVHPLTTGDAFQLAAAIAASEGDPSSLTLVSLDARLTEAAQKEGFSVEPA
jgi:predicted nucleic acid-binding protein